MATIGSSTPIYGPHAGSIVFLTVTDGQRVAFMVTPAGADDGWESGDGLDTIFRSRIEALLERYPANTDPARMLKALVYNMPLTMQQGDTFATWEDALTAAEHVIRDAPEAAPPDLGLSAKGAKNPIKLPPVDDDYNQDVPWESVDPTEPHVFEPQSIVNEYTCAYCYAAPRALIHTESKRVQVIANYGDPSEELAAYDAWLATFDDDDELHSESSTEVEQFDSSLEGGSVETPEWRDVVLPGGRDFLTVTLAAHLAHALRAQLTRTLTLTPYYVQWAPGGPGLQVEVVSDQFLAAEVRITAFGESRMRELGFASPTADDPNWSIWLANEYESMTVAEPLVTALLEVYRLPMPEVIVAVGHLPEPALAPTAHLAPLADAGISATDASEPPPELVQDESGERSWDVAFVVGERDSVRRDRASRIWAVLAIRVFEDAEVLPLVEAFPRAVEFTSLLDLDVGHESVGDPLVYERARQRLNADIAQRFRKVSREWKPRPTDNRFEAFEMLARRLGFPSRLIVTVMPTQIQFEAFVANEKRRLGLAESSGRQPDPSGLSAGPVIGLGEPDVISGDLVRMDLGTVCDLLAAFGRIVSIAVAAGDGDLAQSAASGITGMAEAAKRAIPPGDRWIPVEALPTDHVVVNLDQESYFASLRTLGLGHELAQTADGDASQDEAHLLGMAGAYPTLPPPALLPEPDGLEAVHRFGLPHVELSASKRTLRLALRSTYVDRVIGQGRLNLSDSSGVASLDPNGERGHAPGHTYRLLKVAWPPPSAGGPTLRIPLCVICHEAVLANLESLDQVIISGLLGQGEVVTTFMAANLGTAESVLPSDEYSGPSEPIGPSRQSRVSGDSTAYLGTGSSVPWWDDSFDAVYRVWEYADHALAPELAANIAVSFPVGRGSLPRVEVLPACNRAGFVFLSGQGITRATDSDVAQCEAERQARSRALAVALRNWRVESGSSSLGKRDAVQGLAFRLAIASLHNVDEAEPLGSFDQVVEARRPVLPTPGAWNRMIAASLLDEYLGDHQPRQRSDRLFDDPLSAAREQIESRRADSPLLARAMERELRIRITDAEGRL